MKTPEEYPAMKKKNGGKESQEDYSASVAYNSGMQQMQSSCFLSIIFRSGKFLYYRHCLVSALFTHLFLHVVSLYRNFLTLSFYE